ncbi:MAG: glycosyltransferase family 4 protein [Actinobacteria bacterium]|nr:glycosyltransferase family 4 protein [Actinomycetota bacterium]
MAKVLIHSMIFSPDGVSTAYLMTDLARELKRLGHDITVLTTTPHFNVIPSVVEGQPLSKRRGNWLFASECSGIPVWHVHMPKKTGDVRARLKDMAVFHLLSLLTGVLYLDHDYDAVLCPSPPLTIGLVGRLLGLLNRCPSIYNIQELYPDFAIQQGALKNGTMISLLRAIEKVVYRSNTALVPIAEEFGDVLASRGVPRSKIWLIPNAVDVDLYRPLPRDNFWAQENGLVDDFVVLYAGNIGLAQDWAPLIYAARELQGLPLKFVVVGDGARKGWLEESIRRESLANVTLFEYQRRDLTPYINAGSDVCTILLSREGSAAGLPSKIYSNMASGRATIVSAAEDSPLARVVYAADCGRVVPPGDPEAYARAIVAAMEDREALAQQGRHGREYVVSRYSKRIMAKKYDRLLHALLSSR